MKNRVVSAQCLQLNLERVDGIGDEDVGGMQHICYEVLHRIAIATDGMSSIANVLDRFTQRMGLRYLHLRYCKARMAANWYISTNQSHPSGGVPRQRIESRADSRAAPPDWMNAKHAIF